MQDRQLYAQILGIEAPWKVTEVELDKEQGEVRVRVEWGRKSVLCPSCETECPRHDTRRRQWRHLDTCQFRTILDADVPRVRCEEHGVIQVKVPWSDARSRFTALFESLVLSWLRDASISAVSKQLGLSWDEASGIMQRGVARGLQRRDRCHPTRIGVDETSFRKRHEYVTVVSDLTSGDVLCVTDHNRRESLDSYYEQLGAQGCEGLEVVAMDMSAGYISSTRRYVPNAEAKIAFDKFHVAKKIGHAVDLVRRRENRQLRKQGDHRLNKSRYLWLRNPANMTTQTWVQFAHLRNSSLRTARAWALKEALMGLWHYQRRGWAQKQWKAWLSWAMRSRIEEIKYAARTFRENLQGILNAVISRATNAQAEAINSRIQWMKKMACGFRSRTRFRAAIYFHLGGLDVSPYSLAAP